MTIALSTALCLAAQVVFLGDGYTKGLSADAAWRDGFSAGGRYEAVNLAADGETSASLLKRIDAGLLDGVDAKVAVVAVGANDFRDKGVYALDLVLGFQELIEKLKARLPGAKLVLCPVWPRGAGFGDPVRRKGDATVIPIRDFQNAKDVLWCDVTFKFVNTDGSLVSSMFSGGERLSPAGYATWTKELKRFLDFALGYAKNHPYPQLELAPMFPEEKGLVLEARARFKRHFLTAKERRYRVKLDEVRSRNLREYDSVWVGDSITHFWELWNGTPTFDRLFKPNYEVLNLGFGGDNTRDCLWTILHSGLYEGWKAKTIWLMLGTNNFPTNSPDELVANTAKAMGRVVSVLREKHPEATLLLLPSIPRGWSADNPYRSILAKYNDIIKGFADGKRVVWVGELYGKFIPEDGQITKDILCDGVHPGKTGYRIWGETMLPYMRRYCGDGLKGAARRTSERRVEARLEKERGIYSGAAFNERRDEVLAKRRGRAQEKGEVFRAARWRRSPAVKSFSGAPDGKYRAVELFQKEPSPVVVRFAGEAGRPMERAKARLVLDIFYATGVDNHEWGNRMWLDFSRPGRQEREFVFYPSKPIRHIGAYLGATAECEPRMEPVSVEAYEPAGSAILDGVPVEGVPPRAAGFYVRDAFAESGYSAISDSRGAKGLELIVEEESRGGDRFITAELCDVTGTDRATTLVYAVPLPDGDITWFADIRRSRKVGASSCAEHSETLGGESARGPLSRWPIGAVTAGGRGVAIGVDPDLPGFCRLAVNPRLRVLTIAYDIGLAAPEKISGRVGFVVFPFEAKDGMRGALERYQALYPKYHRDRAKPHGLWSAFYSLSQVKDVQDFGIRYNEHGGEIGWDDANGFLSLRYKEPCTWWMKITKPDGTAASYEECLAMAKDELGKGKPDARAWENSVFKDESGWPGGNILNKPWCNGIAWSMNAAPGIAGFSEFLFKQGSRSDCLKRYAKKKPAGWDGEYIDSSELACTLYEDFDRRHFAAMRTPLVYSSDRKKPCVYSGLCVQEYMAEIRRRMLAVGRISLANGTPYHWSWLVPQTDVPGTEINWCVDGQWKPDPEVLMVFRRALAGPKPYCFLMSTPQGFTSEMTERYFKMSLAYGFMPGFQPSLFRQGLHERDRELFKRYIPLCRKVSEAGWRPVNRLLLAEAKGVRAEQFGDRYATVFNHGQTEETARLSLVSGGTVVCRDLVGGREVKFSGGVAELALGPGEVALIETSR